MDSEELKPDLIHWLANLTPEQKQILDKRIEKYEKGLMTFSSWEDVRSRIIANQ